MELNEIETEKNSDEKNVIDSIPIITRNKSLKNIPPPQYIPENVLLKSKMESSLPENHTLNYSDGNQISNEEHSRKEHSYKEHSGNDENSSEEDEEEKEEDDDDDDDDEESEDEGENQYLNDYEPIISEKEKKYLSSHIDNNVNNVGTNMDKLKIDENFTANNNEEEKGNYIVENEEKFWTEKKEITINTLPSDLPNYFDWREIFPQLQVWIYFFFIFFS